jgi:hypothetical protein
LAASDEFAADGGYNARRVELAVAKQPPLRVEIVKCLDDSVVRLTTGRLRKSQLARSQANARPRGRAPLGQRHRASLFVDFALTR